MSTAQPKTLKDHTDAEIANEVDRRSRLITQCKCTHCEKPWQDCECKLAKEEGMAQNCHQPPTVGGSPDDTFWAIDRCYGPSASDAMVEYKPPEGNTEPVERSDAMTQNFARSYGPSRSPADSDVEETE